MVKTVKPKENRLKDYKGFLDGLVRCGECGKPLNVFGRKKENGRIVYSFYCTDGKNRNKNCNNTKIILTKKLEDIVYEFLKNEMKKLTEEKIIEESNQYITKKRKIKNEIEMLKKEIEIKKVNIKDLYLQKVKNQITVEFFVQKRNDEIEQIKEIEKKILQISEIAEKIRELYDKFKNEDNLMKYINYLVKQINFYSDRKIEIILKYGE